MDERGPSKYSMSVSMYRGGARGNGRPRTAPPDLPSLLLDARICYLGMPVSQQPIHFRFIIYLAMYFTFNDSFFIFFCLVAVDCTCSN